MIEDVERNADEAGAPAAGMSDGRNQALYAGNAFTALAAGFAAAVAAAYPLRRLRTFNLAAAGACGLAACGLRLAARGASSGERRDPPLAARAARSELDYSIIVPVYNRPQFVTALLTRFKAQAPEWSGLGAGEIVIVDDGSVDDTAAVAMRLAGEMPVATRVVSIAHAGPGSARNAGFAAARGAIGVAIDSDCLPEKGWLAGLLNEVRANSKTVAFAQIRSAPKYAYPIENMPDRKAFISASFAMERAVFCALGGFYRGYGMSHEDLDFVQVIKAAGFRVRRADSHIEHPLRRETPATIWRVGFNSKYANLFARRHGPQAGALTRATPYYFFGIAGNYGSSIAFLVVGANIAAAALLARSRAGGAAEEARRAGLLLSIVFALYPLALAVLGIRVGAGPRRLPRYMATLASFQFATLLGRLAGSAEYGLLLL